MAGRSRYRLYVGNISHRVHPRDVEDLFADFGDIVDFNFKPRGDVCKYLLYSLYMLCIIYDINIYSIIQAFAL